MCIASIAPLFMIIPMLMILASSILFAIWVYKDAEANGENGLVWLLVVLVVPNLLGIILYLLLVKREKQVRCENCRHMNSYRADYCEICGSQLDKNLMKESQTNPLWTWALGLLVLGILTILVFFFAAMVYGPSVQ
ncbi:Uncharacterised protein [Urinicoccus massiliensis]|uniref:Cardiolipin synthase N-terminal domain-containing protein n=1 Tax=Urinicoccus massiliensis TaxID=1723382 RepID=A0A8H2M5V6_9FIRM|nr:PLDc N-terminal domain-containing protein [Urinicoccus massiliensis]VFB16959.1 Uncharacterised protein [Urinicoccus massiliensis]